MTELVAGSEPVGLLDGVQRTHTCKHTDAGTKYLIDI
jgi:hypothetical protein